jgi:hypothetical protein
VLSVVTLGPIVMGHDIEAIRIAYCVTAHSNMGEPLNVSLLQQQPLEPVIVVTGTTNPDGCGEFTAVPGALPVMIVIWTTDGFSTGSTGWLDSNDVTGSLVISLASQASPLVE